MAKLLLLFVICVGLLPVAVQAQELSLIHI